MHLVVNTIFLAKHLNTLKFYRENQEEELLKLSPKACTARNLTQWVAIIFPNLEAGKP